MPVNARLHREEIAYILDDSGSAVVVTDDEHADEVEPLVGSVDALQVAVLAPGPRWDRLTGSAPAPLVDRQPGDAAWLFYTSGTTGQPKGATLTHRNLLMASLSYFADIDQVMPQDCILHAAPLSHGSGLYGLPHVARGAVSVVPHSGGVDGDEIAALLTRWPGMSLFAAPTMVKRLVGQPSPLQQVRHEGEVLVPRGADGVQRHGTCLLARATRLRSRAVEAGPRNCGSESDPCQSHWRCPPWEGTTTVSGRAVGCVVARTRPPAWRFRPPHLVRPGLRRTTAPRQEAA